MSDLWSGVAPLAGRDETPGPSLDHAVWFHRPLRADEWMLVDLVPQVAGRGRGFYSGTVRTRGGDPVASLVQESLLRGVRAGSAPASRPGRT